MPEIHHQQPGPSPEMLSSEIHIPDSTNLGTGTFITIFRAGALPPVKAMSSIIVNPPAFQISATVNPNRNVPVLLGRADADPTHRIVFRLPTKMDKAVAYTLKIQFAGWRITGAWLNDVALTTSTH